MPTASTFTQQVSFADLPAPTQSVGAHIAAKLQVFCSDERTLTDELCDMLCIWLGMQVRRSAPSPTDFTLTLSKTTTAEEVKNGADLELVIKSPLGQKRCLIQAKVLDPETGKLRCDKPEGWVKLRKQLLAARKEVGELAFLAVYVPGALLNGNGYGFQTFEQGVHFAPLGTSESHFGVTIIAAGDLIDAIGRWKNQKAKVAQIAPGQFAHGVPFWQFFLELLSCRRSTWKGSSDAQPTATRVPVQATLAVEASQIGIDGWYKVENSAADFLPPTNQDGRSAA